MYAWANQELNINLKRKGLSGDEPVEHINIVPLPKTRKPHDRSAVGMFMKEGAEGAPKPEMEPGQRFDVATYRATCEQIFADLPLKEVADFEGKAQALNEELQRAAASKHASAELPSAL